MKKTFTGIISLIFVMGMIFNNFATTVIYTSNTLNNNSEIIVKLNTTKDGEIQNDISQSNVVEELQSKQNNSVELSVISNGMPEGGLNGNFTYGLRRLAVILAKNKDFTVDFVGYFKESDDKYKVIISSSNAWRNGNWRVDIYPASSEYEKVLDGYHCWFGFYDENRKRIGTAQAVKLKS